MFGSQASTPFGSSGGFGQPNSAPAFGSPAPAPFGAPAPAQSGFGGFGAPAPAPSGFGGFGAPAAPAPSSGFGGFGSPAPAPSGFGAPSAGGFGAAPTSSLFGAPSPAPGGLFGSTPAPTSGGIFGSTPAPASGAFGAPAPSPFGGGGGFGAPAPAPAFGGGGSTFGAPAPASTGLFGAAPTPAPAAGGFGSGGFGASSMGGFGSQAPAPAPGLFGAPAPAPAGGSLFGAPAAATASSGGGTKVQPYQVTNRQDGTSSINLQAITAMPAYENKSFEELRVEDYAQGNRGAGAPGGAVAGGFGAPTGFGSPAPAPSGGLFGSTAPAPAFGAPAPSTGFGGFGAAPSTAPAPAPFGAPAPAPFGASAPGGFGSPAPAPFGAPTSAPGGFGATGFGAKPPASGGLFGAPAPTSGGGLFGAPTPAPAPGGLFGSAPAPSPGGFGAPAPATGLFGAPAPAPFGAPAAAPAFGAPAPGGFGGFGAPAPAPVGGGLFGGPSPAPAFGAPSPGGSLFGAPSPAPGSSLFGASKPSNGSSGGFFGAPAAPAPAAYGYGAPAPSAFGANMQPPAPAAAVPPLGAIIPPANDEILAARMTALEKIRTELENSDNFTKSYKEPSNTIASDLSERDSFNTLAPVRSPYSVYRASPKSSIKVKPRGFASSEKSPAPSLRRLGSGGKPMVPPDTYAASSATRLVINPSPKPKLKLSLKAQTSETPLKLKNESSRKQGGILLPTPQTPSTPATPRGIDTPDTNGKKGYAYYQEVVGSPNDTSAAKESAKSALPILTKNDYACNPPIEHLSKLSAEELATVSNFSIERLGVGKIEWEGAVDIRGINLDQVVEIEPKAVAVYTKAEETNQKPPVGTKLNRAAIITLEGVYAPEGLPEDKFAKKVERQTKKMGANLLDYDKSSGVWKLRVQHFSRYGLDDEEDSSSEAEIVEYSDAVNFESGERGGRSRETRGRIDTFTRQATPYKREKTANIVEMDEDECSDGEKMDTETSVLAEADMAYKALQSKVIEGAKSQQKRRQDTDLFEEESTVKNKLTPRRSYTPSPDDLYLARTMDNVWKKKRSFQTTIDFGMRMGQSFRVGWSPDGSFMRRAKDGSLVRCVPHFGGDGSVDMNHLKQHKFHAKKVQYTDGCTSYVIPSGATLSSALASYVKIPSHSTTNTVKEIFSLLHAIESVRATDISDHTEENMKNRLLISLRRWLIKINEESVEREITTALSENLPARALLIAVSSGNFERLQTVANSLGYNRLVSMLVAGPEARDDILKEMMRWTDAEVSEDLQRAYSILGGDLSREDQIFQLQKNRSFSWQRRLSMILSYDTNFVHLKSILNVYNKKAEDGCAPSPVPECSDHKSLDKSIHICYRILTSISEQAANATPLLQIVDPKGFTKDVHDFSISFHIAACVSSMDLAQPFSLVEAEMLRDGYSAQLIRAGFWEWAVYVALCWFGHKESDELSRNRQYAKNVILRHYQSEFGGKRSFLENLGVPSQWFEEALALRCVTAGDFFGYLTHMVKVDSEEACRALEGTLVPNTLFMNKTSLEEARAVMDAFTTDTDSLAGAVSDLFHIYEEMQHLEKGSFSPSQDELLTLLSTCENVEKVFVAYQTGDTQLQGPSIRLFSGTKIVPMTCFLAESLSQISLFKLQIHALEFQMNLSSKSVQLLRLVRPSELITGNIASRENFLRWLL